jgi:hypothetical protein
MGRRSGTGPRPGTRVEARCAWCGFVELLPAELRVHGSTDGEGLFEFACPSCGRLNVRPLDEADLAALDQVGVAVRSGPAPFELLEPHDGPSISWDDLLDFHQALMGGRRSPGHHRAHPGPRPVQERDAA